MVLPNFNRGGRINRARGGGGSSASARLAVETEAERTTRISEQARHRGALSRRNPRSPAWLGILPSGAHDGEAGPSSAPTRVLVLSSRMTPPLPPIEVDSGTDEVEDDAAREARHFAMACRNSLTTVVTDMWEKAKRARDAADEEERNVRRAKRASIRSEMARCGFIIVDYSDDSTDLSDEDTDDEEE